MVYLYVIDISKLPDPLEHPEYMEELPIERRNKILRMQLKQKRLQSLGAGLLLNQVLCKHGISKDTLTVDAKGKPIAEGGCFSLAHSGDYVICAVSKKEIGCDIEKIKEAPKCVVERVFSPEEIEYLERFSDDMYHREFFRLWTRKESFLKMTGVGLRVPLNTLEMKDCYFKTYEISGYQITVCAKENEFAELLWEEI